MRVGGLLAAVNGRIMEWIIRLNMFRMVFFRSHLKFGNADSFSYALPVKTANYAVECSQPFVLFVVDLISATAYYLPLQDYFIANRDKYEKLKVNTSTISVRIPTRNTVSYADDDLVVVAKSCYCFDSNRDMIIKVR